MRPMVVAHCDWSITAAKRWMAVAVADGERWSLSVPEPVGDVATLIPRLQARHPGKGPVLIGVDFPIGLPRAYGELTGFSSFTEFLENLGTQPWADWWTVAADRLEISLHRPFYPARPGGTQRSHLFDGLGIQPADLVRICETPTPGRPQPALLFWTLGGNQVGKAAISGWRELVIPQRRQIGLWPFDGTLEERLASHPAVVAETYPGDAYGQLGIPRRPQWSKRRQADRRAVAPYLMAWLGRRQDIDAGPMHAVIADGFGADSAGEDRFDCTAALFAMLDVVSGVTSEGPTAITKDEVVRWEGWILGRQ